MIFTERSGNSTKIYICGYGSCMRSSICCDVFDAPYIHITIILGCRSRFSCGHTFKCSEDGGFTYYRKLCVPKPLAFLPAGKPNTHPAIFRMVLRIGRGRLSFFTIELATNGIGTEVMSASSSKEEGQLSAGLEKE